MPNLSPFCTTEKSKTIPSKSKIDTRELFPVGGLLLCKHAPAPKVFCHSQPPPHLTLPLTIAHSTSAALAVGSSRFIFPLIDLRLHWYPSFVRRMIAMAMRCETYSSTCYRITAASAVATQCYFYGMEIIQSWKRGYLEATVD